MFIRDTRASTNDLQLF